MSTRSVFILVTKLLKAVNIPSGEDILSLRICNHVRWVLVVEKDACSLAASIDLTVDTGSLSDVMPC